MATIGKINDVDFAGLGLDDPNDNEIAQQAAQNLPIALPWGREPESQKPGSRKRLRLGTCYQSSLQSSKDQSPWREDTPFILSDLYMMPRILHRERGTDATYKSVSTSRECETGDHLSLGFGVGIGLPFLASVSVKGTYDRDVHENRDSEKTSIRSSVRSATVELERAPRLTTEAIIAIKYGGGYEAFCKRYGDYYLAGYRIGGETGLLISSSSFRTEKHERVGITVTLEILFIEISKTWTKDFYDFSSGKSMKLLGYDTLDGANWNTTSKDSGVEVLRSHALDLVKRSHCILDRVDKVVDNLGLCDGQDLTEAQCDALLQAGVVVELVLLPMASVRDVAKWRIEQDII